MEHIYGNDGIKSALLQAVRSDRLCHAYLLCGEPGLGRKTLARFFAQTILCSSPTEEGPCGCCPSCREVSCNTHPDLFTAPSDKPLPVAAVREIRERSFVRPNSGKYNVFIIPEADRMEGSSYNALLKVLEEPPGKTVFILTAAGRNTVPETISSRCIPVLLERLSGEELQRALSERPELADKTERELQEACAYADGNLGKALSLLTDPAGRKACSLAGELAKALFAGREYQFLMLLQGGVSDREELQKVNALLIHLLRRELLSGGKVSGFAGPVLLDILAFCRETGLQLRRPYSIALMTASYTAGIFQRSKEGITI